MPVAYKPLQPSFSPFPDLLSWTSLCILSSTCSHPRFFFPRMTFTCGLPSFAQITVLESIVALVEKSMDPKHGDGRITLQRRKKFQKIKNAGSENLDNYIKTSRTSISSIYQILMESSLTIMKKKPLEKKE